MLGAGLRLTNLDVPNRSPDERTYTIHANIVAESGLAGVRALVDKYNSTPMM